jgi:hypothetical protein
MEELSEDVMHFRLITGEDIIAQVLLEDSSGGLTLGFPMKVVLLPTKDGAYRISLMEWIFSRVSPAQTYDVKSRDVITSSIPSDIIVEYYWEALAVLEEKRKTLVKTDSRHNETKEIEDFLDELEDQVDEEGSEFIKNLLSAFTSNNKGTLH